MLSRQTASFYLNKVLTASLEPGCNPMQTCLLLSALMHAMLRTLAACCCGLALFALGGGEAVGPLLAA